MKRILLFIVVLLVLLCGVAVAEEPTIVASGECGTSGSIVTWALDDAGTLTISGEGKMQDYYNSSNAPWYANRTSIKTAVIKEGVTSIGDFAFRDCNKLSSVDLPEGVTSIGNYAFRYCSSLRKVMFHGKDMPTLGSNVFSSSPTIYCHEGSEVDEWAMTNGYTIVYLEDHTHTPIADPAVPATHVTSGLTEGSHCSVCGEVLAEQKIVPVVEVEKMQLPAELKTIEAEAFAGDTFVCAVLPEGCKAIGAGAFRDCAQLRFIEIPESVTSIDSTAFDGCGSLIVVTVSGSVAERFAQEQNITCVLR